MTESSGRRVGALLLSELWLGWCSELDRCQAPSLSDAFKEVASSPIILVHTR